MLIIIMDGPLQDASAHKGRHDVGIGHILNDFHGSTKSAQALTGSALTVYKLLTNDFEGIKTNKKGKLSIDLSGMSGEQKQQVLGKAREFLDSQDN